MINKVIFLVFFLFLQFVSNCQTVYTLFDNNNISIKASSSTSINCSNTKFNLTGIGNRENKFYSFYWNIPYKKCDGLWTKKRIEFRLPPGNKNITKEVIIEGTLIIGQYKEPNVTPNYETIELPNVSISPINAEIYQNESFSFNASLFGPNSNLSEIIWEDKNGKEVSRGREFEFSPNGREGKCQFFVYSRYKGISSVVKKTISILVKPIPTPYIKSTSPLPIKEGESVELKAFIKDFDKSKTWKWTSFTNGVKTNFSAYGPSITVSPNGTTNYVVEAVFSNNNSKVSAPITVSVIPAPIPPTPPIPFSANKTIKEGDSILLSINTSNFPSGTKVIWEDVDRKKIIEDNGSSVIVKPRKTTTYKVYTILTTGKITKRSEEKSIKIEVIELARAPEQITGDMIFCEGTKPTTTTLKIIGGKLGSNSKVWKWYKGKCNSGEFMSKGEKIILPLPSKTTIYSVSPENDPGACKEFTIVINQNPILPNKISVSSDKICPGEAITLNISGGQNNEGTKTIWSFKQESKTSYIKIGEGTEITHKPVESGLYSVESVNKCKSLPQSNYVPIIVNDITYSYGYISDEKNKSGKNIHELDVYYGKLSGDGDWYWYADGYGQKLLHKGKEFTLKDKSVKTIYLRAENSCNTKDILSQYIDWTKPKYQFGFLNVGIVGTTMTDYQNLYLAIGSQSFYGKIKYSLNNNKLFNFKYECNDTKILNYPANTNTYYSFNNEAQITRNSLVLGFMFPKSSKHFKFYSGVGYSQRLSYWGINVYQYYSDAFLYQSWAKSSTQSMSGPEVEAGIFFRLGKINFAGGINVMSSQNKTFIDASFGIGFCFRDRVK